ncbi:hypothetical protein FDP41_013691 [Naegleria fowleri]|uniref:Uncharacterized protein n=1 Tax=Naegleria fowleri TaxID=5763 RepID=A0A6A5BTF8_NAEFO|nr:uncharacterized protein FDP41_013691 [Naegleria fowleri]KAF0980477.1 hypothetical protein FDP41_013691 [Naegleria fowleri]
MAEEGRIQQVWTFILLICSCVIFSFLAILFGILTAAYYDPNEMLNTMSCVVVEPHHDCSLTPECAGGKVECCTAIVSVKPGTLFANVSTFQPLRTTLAFTEESTYYNYKQNATVTCYVSDRPEDTVARYNKYDGVKMSFRTTAIVTGSIAILCTAGVLLAPFFSRAMKQVH